MLTIDYILLAVAVLAIISACVAVFVAMEIS
jgi:hypothetical protein